MQTQRLENKLFMSNVIMVMGCTSDAGKSFLCSLLCRYFANKEVSVAPFKAQNMSNNAAVTEQGLEIGRAQYFQALAARQVPHTDFNPVLLKPQADVLSQIVVEGVADRTLNSLDWHSRKDRLWPVVQTCLNRVVTQNDVVVVEGAGSPAEVNLRQSDIVNFEVALAVNADVYLVVDIDKGGAYAHLLGTLMCLSERERALVKGFVLNKFRGDESLLKDANDWIYQQTGIAVKAVIPYIRNTLPEEDNFFHRSATEKKAVSVGLMMYPFASNLDEFDSLAYHDQVALVPIKSVTDFDHIDALILPGSKHVHASWRYLDAQGYAEHIIAFAQSKRPVLGICGGLQLLGEHVYDDQGIEGATFRGLGLLPLYTHFQDIKTTRRRTVRWQQADLTCYEIHQGSTVAVAVVDDFIEPNSGFQQGAVYATYLHGLFENNEFVTWFLALLGVKNQQTQHWYDHLDAELDRLETQLRPRIDALLS